MGKRDHRSITLRGDMTVAFDIVKRLKIISGNICKGPAASISALYLKQLLSTLSLCWEYCEAFTEPSSVRRQCMLSISAVEGEGGWERGQWTWIAARTRVGFTLAKVTLCSLWLAPLTQSGWEQKPITGRLPWAQPSHVGQSLVRVHVGVSSDTHTHTVYSCSTCAYATNWVWLF